MSEKKRLEAEYRKAIITPATIQKALMEARSDLSDQDIFCSGAYQRQLISLGAYLVGRTGRKDIRIRPRRLSFHIQFFARRLCRIFFRLSFFS